LNSTINKYLLIGIIFIVLTVGLSGCVGNNEDKDSDWESNWEKQNENEANLKSEFEIAMETVAADFVDESSEYNIETSQNERDYILNYNQKEFDKHSSLIYEGDDICNKNSGYKYYYEYQDCRNHVIEGLQHLLNNQYNDAYSSLLTADCDIFEANSFTGDMWCIQFGFEDGVCDILWDMGYRP